MAKKKLAHEIIIRKIKENLQFQFEKGSRLGYHQSLASKEMIRVLVDILREMSIPKRHLPGVRVALREIKQCNLTREMPLLIEDFLPESLFRQLVANDPNSDN